MLRESKMNEPVLYTRRDLPTSDNDDTQSGFFSNLISPTPAIEDFNIDSVMNSESVMDAVQGTMTPPLR